MLVGKDARRAQLVLHEHQRGEEERGQGGNECVSCIPDDVARWSSGKLLSFYSIELWFSLNRSSSPPPISPRGIRAHPQLARVHERARRPRSDSWVASRPPSSASTSIPKAATRRSFWSARHGAGTRRYSSAAVALLVERDRAPPAQAPEQRAGAEQGGGSPVPYAGAGDSPATTFAASDRSSRALRRAPSRLGPCTRRAEIQQNCVSGAKVPRYSGRSSLKTHLYQKFRAQFRSYGP